MIDLPLRRAVVSVTAALPIITVLSLVFNLASTMLASPADLIRDVDEVKNIVLQCMLETDPCKIGELKTYVFKVVHDVEELLGLLIFIA